MVKEVLNASWPQRSTHNRKRREHSTASRASFAKCENSSTARGCCIAAGGREKKLRIWGSEFDCLVQGCPINTVVTTWTGAFLFVNAFYKLNEGLI